MAGSTEFTWNTSSVEWSNYLISKQEYCHNPSEHFVYPLLLSYKNQKVKSRWINQAMNLDPGFCTEKDWNDWIEGWKSPSCVSTVRGKLRATGTLVVLSGPAHNAAERSKALKNGADKDAQWHTYAIFWKDGVLGLYDPSLDPDAKVGRLKGLFGVKLLTYLIADMKENGMAVNEMWAGGGGNTSDNCQEMTRAWINEELAPEEKAGKELGMWEGREGWRRIKF